MKKYKVRTIQYHTSTKVVYVEAKNKAKAIAKARDYDWYDAEKDEFTGDIDRITVRNIEEIE